MRVMVLKSTTGSWNRDCELYDARSPGSIVVMGVLDVGLFFRLCDSSSYHVSAAIF